MPRFAALDTKFLLALAGGESDAEATIDYLHRNDFFPIATESVIEQLGELSEKASPETQAVAKYAAKWLVVWGILPSENKHCQNGTSQVLAEKILAQDLIPNATKLEAEILLEASCHNCELLVTFSESLLAAAAAPLNLALLENDLNKVTITIASPSLIAQRFSRQVP